MLNVKELTEHLRFHYLDGRLTPVEVGHGTQWRFMPWTVVVQVVGGDFEVFLDNDRTLVGQAGDCMLASDLRHRMRITSATGPGPIICRWAHIHFTLFESVNLLSFFKLPVIIRGAAAETFGSLCARMHEIANSEQRDILYRAVALERAGFEVLEGILTQGSLVRNVETFFQETQRFAKTLGLIANNKSRQFTIQELADTAGLSPSRFHALFKEVFGVSPMAYIRQHRMEEARLLLSSTNMTVSEVAFRTGYSDQFHFSRHFKKRFGLSPSAFRTSIHV